MLTAELDTLLAQIDDCDLHGIIADALDEDGQSGAATALRTGGARGYQMYEWLHERRVYYHESARGFANEYTVYVVPQSLTSRFEAAFPEADRISRKRAVYWGWSRPREASRDGEQWFGGFESGNHDDREWITVYRALDGACRATVEAIEFAEMIQEQN